jgi:hypothetical protein
MSWGLSREKGSQECRLDIGRLLAPQPAAGVRPDPSRTPRSCDFGATDRSRMNNPSAVRGYWTFTRKLSTDVPGFSSMLCPFAVTAKLSEPW